MTVDTEINNEIEAVKTAQTVSLYSRTIVGAIVKDIIPLQG
jgi:hypothetical protein